MMKGNFKSNTNQKSASTMNSRSQRKNNDNVGNNNSLNDTISKNKLLGIHDSTKIISITRITWLEIACWRIQLRNKKRLSTRPIIQWNSNKWKERRWIYYSMCHPTQGVMYAKYKEDNDEEKDIVEDEKEYEWRCFIEASSWSSITEKVHNLLISFKICWTLK